MIAALKKFLTLHTIGLFVSTFASSYLVAWQAAGSKVNVSALISLVPAVAAVAWHKVYRNVVGAPRVVRPVAKIPAVAPPAPKG